MRKGQTATELFMTYGWALLAIIIVGSMLYFKLTQPDSFSCDKLITIKGNIEAHYPQLLEKINNLTEDGYEVKQMRKFQLYHCDVNHKNEFIDCLCSEDVLLCKDNVCYEAKIMIPVNISEWSRWYYGTEK